MFPFYDYFQYFAREYERLFVVEWILYGLHVHTVVIITNYCCCGWCLCSVCDCVCGFAMTSLPSSWSVWKYDWPPKKLITPTFDLCPTVSFVSSNKFCICYHTGGGKSSVIRRQGSLQERDRTKRQTVHEGIETENFSPLLFLFLPKSYISSLWLGGFIWSPSSYSSSALDWISNDKIVL